MSTEKGMKYVVVTGGVLSGLGKGVIASSIGRLLRSHGHRVTAIKIDPYLNIDAGTMSPFEHGEVYVLDDGGEADLDLGNYERFMDLILTKDNNITTGKIYNSVIEKERKGTYLGKTVQVVPHICNEIQDWIEKVANIPTDKQNGPPDICVIELGGTIGDIESMPFIEALRQFQFRVGRNNMCIITVSLVPILGTEEKTKPTQNAIRELRALGLSPDIIMCRSETPLSLDTKDKISSFCHVSKEAVIDVYNVSNLYRVPQLLADKNVYKLLCNTLQCPLNEHTTLPQWSYVADIYDELQRESDPIYIAMVGKYNDMVDSYHSVVKALQHASFAVKKKVVINWVDSVMLEDKNSSKHEDSWNLIKKSHGILVPGGFGDRGVEGKILAVQYARENNVPYLGICLGMQIAVIEAARHILGWEDANSAEFDDKTTHPVVIFMPEISKTVMGGNMRLGKRRTYFTSTKSIAYKLYKKTIGTNEEFDYVDERHRHRYEVNTKLLDELSKSGLEFVGQDESGLRQEIVERPDHPFFVGVQYHPEFYSRPTKPSPVFVGLLLASSGTLNQHIE